MQKVENEGEFKRRLHKVIQKDAEHEYGKGSFGEEWFEDYFKIVEDAKKEFKIYMEDEFEGDEQDYITYIDQIIRKWFGSNAEPTV